MCADVREAAEPEDIIREIKSLVADGVVEVMLLGQNVNSYGKTLDESDYICTASGRGREDRRTWSGSVL